MRDPNIADFDIEVPFTFVCDHTGIAVEDWTFGVSGHGDRRDGQVLGWEIDEVFEKIPQVGGGTKKTYYDLNHPLVAYVVSTLQDDRHDNNRQSREFHELVCEIAEEVRRAA